MSDFRKVRKRGFVWLLVGILVYVGGILANRPFVLRGTDIPFGLILIGLGVVFIGWDLIQARRSRSEGESPQQRP